MPVYKDLLGHSLEKFAAVTVFDATFYDPATNRPLITFDTLTVSNISTESEQKEIRGGQGAALLVSYDYGKTATVEITDALASIYSLKYLWGAQINKEKVSALVKKELVFDEATGTIATDLLPGIDLTKVVTVLATDENGREFYQEFDAGDTITIDDEVKAVKATVYYTREVDGEAASHVGEIILTSTDFPPIVKLVGETFFIDAKTGKRVEAQIEIPRFKLDANFELTFEAEGDASVFDFSGTALADGNNIVVLRTLGYEPEVEVNEGEGSVEEGSNPEEDYALE